MTLVETLAAWPFAARALLCVVVTFAFDVCYARYTLRAAAHRPGAAATYSLLVYLLGAFNIVSYSRDIRLIGPIVLGGWMGTYTAVWRERQQGRPQGRAGTRAARRRRRRRHGGRRRPVA